MVFFCNYIPVIVGLQGNDHFVIHIDYFGMVVLFFRQQSHFLLKRQKRV